MDGGSLRAFDVLCEVPSVMGVVANIIFKFDLIPLFLFYVLPILLLHATKYMSSFKQLARRQSLLYVYK